MKVHTVFSVYQCVRVAGMVGVFKVVIITNLEPKQKSA